MLEGSSGSILVGNAKYCCALYRTNTLGLSWGLVLSVDDSK